MSEYLTCACGERRFVGADWNGGNIWACVECKPELFCDQCNLLEYPLKCPKHEVNA